MENLKERDRFEEIDMKNRVILKLVLGHRIGSRELVNLVQDSEKWSAVVNTVKNLRVP